MERSVGFTLHLLRLFCESLVTRKACYSLVYISGWKCFFVFFSCLYLNEDLAKINGHLKHFRQSLLGESIMETDLVFKKFSPGFSYKRIYNCKSTIVQ